MALVHLVEEVLRFDEEAPVAPLERAHEDGAGDAGLAHAGLTHEDDVGRAVDEVERGELLDGGALEGGLLLPREGVEGPSLGEPRAPQAVLEEAHLLVLKLLAQDAPQELGIAGGFGLSSL